MKKTIVIVALIVFLAGIWIIAQPEESAAEITESTVTFETQPPTTEPLPETQPTETEPTKPPIVLDLTEEEQTMLLKIGMAELGNGDCTECIALVMRTVLNRVEAGGFGSSIKGVILAEGQFTPVSDGSYYRAQPSDACFAALDLVRNHWDESQGALYYEFCEGNPGTAGICSFCFPTAIPVFTNKKSRKLTFPAYFSIY